MVNRRPEGSCLLAIPCYRESQRLPAFLSDLVNQLAQGDLNVDLQVVDDGSGPGEFKKLALLLDTHEERGCVLPLIGLASHKGKGAAIRAAWDASSRRYDWFGFVDADGAVPADDVIRLVRLALDGSNTADAIIGSRWKTGTAGHRVRRKWYRKMIGHLFARAVHARLHLPVEDTQCGFKMIQSAAYASIRGRLKIDGLGMDLELLLQLHRQGYRIVEEAIDWMERSGSHVPLREHVLLIRSLLMIR
ncbi:MAG: glycosyltransferase [Opitutales bacterium]|nr:glycosyltransferase [Opitutales bacterium]